MKISFEKKILAGFIINLLVVIASGWIFVAHIDMHDGLSMNSVLNWTEFSLFFLSVTLLTIVYFIIRSQWRAKNVSQALLFENKMLLQSILDNTSSPVFIKKLNGEYLLVNKQYEALFQIPSDKIIGKTDHDFLPKQTADTFRNSDLEAVKALKEIKTEETIQLSDGSHTYIAVKFPLFDSLGKIYAVGGISTDITERKKIEESIKAGDKFFSMSIDIMAVASNEKFIKINPTMSKILGYSEDELLNQPFYRYICPDDIEITKKEIEKLQTGTPTIKFENRWVCRDGSIKWLSWSATPDVSTGLLYAVANDVTEWKEAQKSLVFSDKFFNMTSDIFLLAKGEIIIKINPALTRTFGFDLKDITNKSLLSLVHPDDLKAFTDEFKKLQAGASIMNSRVRSVCKDGSYKWVVWSATSDIQTGMVFAAGRDITELIEKEESLKISESFFEMSFDPFVVTKGTQIIKINPAVNKILGYYQNDIYNKSFLDYIHPDYKQIATERSINRGKGSDVGSHFEYPILCKNGNYKWMEIMISSDINTGMSYTVLEDISQQKIIEEKINDYNKKLKDNERQLKTIFDGAPDSVIVIDEDSKILRWNPKAETFFGWKETEVIGKPLSEFIIPSRYQELHAKGIEKLAATGLGPILNKTTEMEAINKEKKEFPVAVSVSSAKMGEKNVFIGFVRDITETKKVINDLHENEKMLQLILENIAEGVVVANADKKVVMTNYIANKIFGIQENNEMSPNLINHSEVFYPDEKTIFPVQNLPMEHAFNGEVLDDVDVVVVDSVSKEKKRLLISARPLVNQEDKVVAAVVTIKDISKYKQLEAELKESESKYRQLIGFRTSGDAVV
jgi:PAS domain S-box-containing protein